MESQAFEAVDRWFSQILVAQALKEKWNGTVLLYMKNTPHQELCVQRMSLRIKLAKVPIVAIRKN